MADYDLVIAGGTVVTPADMFQADVGVVGDKIAAVGVGLRGRRSIDAHGLLVGLPRRLGRHAERQRRQPHDVSAEDAPQADPPGRR